MLAEAGTTVATVVTRASGETTPRPGTAPTLQHYNTTTPGRQTQHPASQTHWSLWSQSNDNDNKSNLQTLSYLPTKLNGFPESRESLRESERHC